MERENKKLKVNELTPTSRRFDITVKVLSLSEERSVKSSKDGKTHRVAEALVGDETGTVLMTLWDDDIDEVSSYEGETITLKNGYVTVFRGSLRLNKGRYGSIEKSGEINEVNEENNISEKEVEVPGFSWRRRSFNRRRKRY